MGNVPLTGDLRQLFAYLPAAATAQPRRRPATPQGRFASPPVPTPVRQQPSGWPSGPSQPSQASQPGPRPDLWQTQQAPPGGPGSGATDNWLWRPEGE